MLRVLAQGAPQQRERDWERDVPQRERDWEQGVPLRGGALQGLRQRRGGWEQRVVRQRGLKQQGDSRQAGWSRSFRCFGLQAPIDVRLRGRGRKTPQRSRPAASSR